ncbi:MAG: hypothetical protein WC236_09325 [Gallionellaceae bacterium]
MRQHIFYIMIASSLLAGCAFQPIPQNAAEFRNLIKGGGYGTVTDTFVVKRPYKDVAANVKAKASQCLNAQIDKRSCTHTRYSTDCNDYADKYFATVVNGVAKTEVQVQFNRDGERVGIVALGDKPMPSKGMYIVVADISPIENGKAAKVDIYSTNPFKAVPNAIKLWSENSNQGCPTFKDL